MHAPLPSPTPQSGFARALLAAALLLSPLLPAAAQTTPQALRVTGRVTVSNTGFHGQGKFKFVLRSASGGTTNLWSNDGTATGEPATALTLAVDRGHYSVLLGQGMTSLGSAVFNQTDLVLATWFDDGTRGSQRLLPDQVLSPSAYAFVTDSLRDGAVGTSTLAAGSVTSAALAAGSITATQLAPGVAQQALAAGGVSTVPAGTILLSDTAENTTLTASGFTPFGRLTTSPAQWTERNSGAITNRHAAATCWTGSEFFICGGANGAASGTAEYNTSYRYNPATNVWTQATNIGALSARSNASCVWTGTEVIVFGGYSGVGGGGTFKNGARYKPSTDTWTAMADGPSFRYDAIAVWTGTRFLVWGGITKTGTTTTTLADGSLWNPNTNAWTTISASGAPQARRQAGWVWTGTELIIWGGSPSSLSTLDDGFRYNPATDDWTEMTGVNAPSARAGHSAVWTGKEMIVWGGNAVVNIGPTKINQVYRDGARYDPADDRWLPLSDAGAPAARFYHSAVWTGKEMLLFGGTDTLNQATLSQGMNSGARYLPELDSWTALSVSSAPSPRYFATPVWTGTDLLLWGGLNQGDLVASPVWLFRPLQEKFLFKK